MPAATANLPTAVPLSIPPLVDLLQSTSMHKEALVSLPVLQQYATPCAARMIFAAAIKAVYGGGKLVPQQGSVVCL